MRRTKREIMDRVECTKSRIINRNTIEYWREDGSRVIRLHLTDIVTYNPDGSVTLNTGGWKTITTKDRISNYSPFRITQRGGIWYIDVNGEEHLFKDGMTVYPDGKVVGGGEKDKKIFIKHMKLIKEYCKKLKELDKLPYPSNGDCWYCLFRNEEGKTWGDFSNNNNHLLEHLKEVYIHGSLIFNALKWAGYSFPSLILQMDLRDSVVSSIRRYFKFKLGYPY